MHHVFFYLPCSYLDNIINNPAEVKFRKIRVQNKNFQEKVLCVIGSDLFLKAIGFQLKVLPFEGYTNN